MFLLSIVQTVYDAVTDIFNKYLPMMKNLAYSLLKDDQLSEDAVQEALVKLSQNTHKIDNIKSNAGKNYIYTVTKNEALKILRNEKKINSFEKDVQFYDKNGFNNIEGSPDIDAFRDENGFSMEIAEALKKLSETDKDIIVYKYGAGYSLKEIAQLMDLDREVVYKRHQRALEKLRAILEAEDEK